MEKQTIYSSAPKPPKQIRVEEDPVEPIIEEQVLPENKEEQPSNITVMQPTVSKNTVVQLNTEKQPEPVLKEEIAEESPLSGSTTEYLAPTEEAKPYEVLEDTKADVENVLAQMPNPERNSTEEQLELGEIHVTENVTASPNTVVETETTEGLDPEKNGAEEQNELAEIDSKTNDDSIAETTKNEDEIDIVKQPHTIEFETTIEEADNYLTLEKLDHVEVAAATISEAKVLVEKVSKSPKHKNEAEHEFENLKIPSDDELFQRQYYTMGEVATMFHANQSQIRFWENEFDILQPKKNKKGDRYFRPEDVKNLQVIHHLLRNRRFTIEGAREYLKSNKQRTQDTVAAIASLGQLKSFLTELKASL